MQKKDVYFIRKTFQLARKAEGFTSPNPLVGALIVKKNKIISEGYHKKCGLPHAEVEAIKKAGKKKCQGATLYVNLEPCFHFGRTPPCVDMIIKNKFKRVVVATYDPNPETNGKSIRKLKNAGIKVKVGLAQKEAYKLNEIFFKNIKTGMPFVVAKIAQSLDGKIATKKGISQWITSEKSRKMARSLRDIYDCVLVGVNTVLKDNPSLEGLKKVPFKVVIDPRLRIPLNSNLLRKDPKKVIIFTSYNSRNKNKRKRISPLVKVFFLKESKGWFSLKKILKILFNQGIMSIFVEGGSQTIGRFFDEKLVDKVFFFIAPKIIGGKSALTSIGAEGISQIKKATFLKDIEIKNLKDDILIKGYPNFA